MKTKKSEKYFKVVKDGVGTKPVPVTLLQVKKAEEFYKKLENLRKKRDAAARAYDTHREKCKHDVLWDEDGFMYYQRNCLSCGSTVAYI